jgi:predicted dehydrogenase
MHDPLYSSREQPVSRRSFLALIGTAGALLIERPTDILAAEPGASPHRHRIGFVDDNLNNYHSNVFLQALRGPLNERGFVAAGCTGLKEAEGKSWAEKNNIPYFPSVEELDRAVDFYMVLAPSTPETHLRLCERVLPFKKPTYVDKTFAPDLETARRIFALADKHGAPIQTTSALRYTNVQEAAGKAGANSVEHMITWGGGGSFDEYAIHPTELLISVVGHEVESLMRRGRGDRSQLLVNFSRGRTGVVNVYTRSTTPFAATLTTAQGTRYIEVDASRIFVANMAALLDFFESGRPNVDRRESLAIMKILDAARKPEALERFVPLG